MSDVAFRSAEFFGSDAIGEAFGTLLDDSSLAAVVIREIDYRPQAEDLLKASETICELYNNIPGLKSADVAVQDWWDTNPVPDFSLVPRLDKALVSQGSIGAHIDMPLARDGKVEGPVTFSYRVDSLDTTRTFYVRPTCLNLCRDGFIDKDTYARVSRMISNDTKLTFGKLATRDYVAIQQKPGDMVAFRNFPSPTLHAVDTSPLTKAIVASYALKSNKSNGSLRRD